MGAGWGWGRLQTNTEPPAAREGESRGQREEGKGSGLSWPPRSDLLIPVGNAQRLLTCPVYRQTHSVPKQEPSSRPHCHWYEGHCRDQIPGLAELA